MLRFGGREIDRIVSAEFEPVRAGWIEGTWRQGWSRRPVWLRRRRGDSPLQPWVAFDVRESLFLANVRNFAAVREKEVFGGGRVHGEDLILADTRSGDRLDDVSQIEVEAAVRVGAEGAAALLDPLAAPDRFSAQTYRRLQQGLTRGSQ